MGGQRAERVLLVVFWGGPASPLMIEYVVLMETQPEEVEALLIGVFSTRDDTTLPAFVAALEKYSLSYFRPFKAQVKTFRMRPKLKPLLPFSADMELEFDLLALPAARQDRREDKLYHFCGITTMPSAPREPFTLRSYGRNFQLLEDRAEIRPVKTVRSRDDLSRLAEGVGLELRSAVIKDGVAITGPDGEETRIYSLYPSSQAYSTKAKFVPPLTVEQD